MESSLFFAVRLTGIFLPTIAYLGFRAGGAWTWAGFATLFGFYLLIEFVLAFSGIGAGTTHETEFRFRPTGVGRFRDLPILFFLLQEFVYVPLVVLGIREHGFRLYEAVGTVLSFGFIIGVAGTLAAHEFVHRRSRFERWLGTAAFGLVNYAHFGVAHVRGHHRNVGRWEDWSTARRGETSYAFIFRAFVDGWRGAWKLDRVFMIRWTMLQVFLGAFLFRQGGMGTLGFYLTLSVIACALNELVNYLGHYGLVRKRLSSGELEPIQSKHSWESNNKVTDWLLFGAGKHCDHHSRPFQRHDRLELSYIREFIPYGVPVLALMALVPPLFFRIFHPVLDRTEIDHGNSSASSRRIS